MEELIKRGWIPVWSGVINPSDAVESDFRNNVQYVDVKFAKGDNHVFKRLSIDVVSEDNKWLLLKDHISGLKGTRRLKNFALAGSGDNLVAVFAKMAMHVPMQRLALLVT
ncbi:hypothetical protein HDU81_006947, partial [Chytriomyces hyalinus]